MALVMIPDKVDLLRAIGTVKAFMQDYRIFTR
jgi:hypothetical protein